MKASWGESFSQLESSLQALKNQLLTFQHHLFTRVKRLH